MNVRELKYVLLGDDRLSRVMGDVSQSADKATSSLDKQSTKLAKLRGNADTAASKLPGVGSAISKLISPTALLGGAVVGVGFALEKASAAAKNFNHSFMDIEQINLDKSEEQLKKIKGDVLDLAYRRGFNAEKTAMGTFDVQSITGKFGMEAEMVVDKVGQFAQTMKADFNKSISGAAQAMEIYGFGVSKLDKFLESSYKTVLVGKTTFDQLAQVQVEYANAAASAGQDFNAANKVFAAFSKNAKTVDIAATLAKTAFQDLAKESTIQGLKGIDVHLFDAQNKLLGIDSVMNQLVPKLKGMDDVRFAKLKEDIGGSEGIRALLDMAKNSGDALLGTFKSFDEATYDKGKAMSNALKDASVQADILDNKLAAAMAKYGQNIAGLKNLEKRFKIFGVEFASVVGEGYDFMTGVNTKARKIDRAEELGKKKLFEDYIGLIDEAREGNWDRPRLLAHFAELENKRTELLKESVGKKNSDILTWFDDTKKAGYYTGQANAIQELKGMLQQAYFEGGEKAAARTAALVAPTQSATTTAAKTPDPIRRGIDSISGGGAVRNVNVTVQKFTESVNINSSTFTEETSQVIDILGEYFIRMIQGAETAVQSY